MHTSYKSSSFLVLAVLVLVAGSWSCVKSDNYPAPGEAIKGTVYDSTTGLPMQADHQEIRVELLETSWTQTPPAPDPYFWTDDSGFYQNTKVFKGSYNVNVNGPFVPLNRKLWPSPNKDTTDQSYNEEIQGTVTQNFTVSPILEINWVGDPVYNSADSTISATVIVNRGTQNPFFQKPVTDINLYMCETSWPGDGNRDSRYSAFNNSSALNTHHFVLGQPYTIKSIGKLTPRTWWVRVASRTNVALPTGQPYNYSTIKSVTVEQH
jgi:hypothetical protein